MKRKNRTCLFIILLVAGWFCSASVFSRESSDLLPEREADLFLPGSRDFSPRMILEMSDALSLSPVQFSRITKIVQELEEYFILSLAELKIRELRLATSIRNPDVSRNAVGRAIREMGKIHSLRLVRFLSAILEIRQTLTPEQRNVLSSLRSDARKRQINRR